MRSIPIVAFFGNEPTHPATTKAGSEMGYGARLALCCGSQLVSNLAIDEGNRGITLAINDEQSKLASCDEYLIESVCIDGVWFNFKLNNEPDPIGEEDEHAS